MIRAFHFISLVFLVLIPPFVAEQDYYSLLGVDRTATKDEIQKAFNKLSLKYHPDKVQDSEKEAAMARYQAITNAYEVLMDDDQRTLYDQGGEEAVRRGTSAQESSRSPFDDFFFSFNNMNDPFRHQTRRPDNVIPLDLTLEEIFTGKQIETVVSRRVICGSCKGQGAPPSGMRNCRTCGGSGVVMVQQHIPFGIISKQIPCEKCKGTGKIITEKCVVCKGGGSVMKSEKVTVTVPPGASDGHQIVFDGYGDEYPNEGKNKLIFRVRERKMIPDNPPFESSPNHPDPYDHVNVELRNKKIVHPFFVRDSSNNLHTNITISLSDSITGNEFHIPHFINHTVTINRKGEVTPDGTVVEIRDEGMPLPSHRTLNPLSWFSGSGWKKGMRRGSLFVTFHVVYPSHISEKQADLIKQALH